MTFWRLNSVKRTKIYQTTNSEEKGIYSRTNERKGEIHISYCAVLLHNRCVDPSLLICGVCLEADKCPTVDQPSKSRLRAIHAAILLLRRSPNMANVLYEYLHLISGNPVDIKSEGEKKTPWPQNSFRRRYFAFLNVFVSPRSFSLNPFKSKPEIRIFRLKHARVLDYDDILFKWDFYKTYLFRRSRVNSRLTMLVMYWAFFCLLHLSSINWRLKYDAKYNSVMGKIGQ